MARRRYQNGSITIRGSRRKVWVARYYEDAIARDGTLLRIRRSVVLGTLTEVPKKRDALKKLDSILRPINEGRHQPTSTITFKEFVEENWTPVINPLVRIQTAKFYRVILRCHLLPTFGSTRLCDLRRAEIQAFLAGKLKVGYSNSHVHGMRNVLSKILTTAQEWEYLETNPVRGIKLGSRETRRQTIVLSPEDFLSLTKHLPEPCRTIVLVLALTGLRIGELLALRWTAIDFLHGKIAVRESMTNGRFGPPKTRSSRRIVPMGDAVKKLLTAHHSRRSSNGEEDLVFATKLNTPMNPANMKKRVLHPTCEKLDLPKVTWHGFRHLHATLLSEAGESVKTAQSLLGHSDLGTTLNVYTHPVAESLYRAVNNVGRILDPNGPKSTEERETLTH